MNTNELDANGDVWIFANTVSLSIPNHLIWLTTAAPVYGGSVLNPGLAEARTLLNLSGYIRHLMDERDRERTEATLKNAVPADAPAR